MPVTQRKWVILRPIYTIHIKSNFINFNFLIIFYVRFKERKAIGRLQLG
jgi:hypothetical protein